MAVIWLAAALSAIAFTIANTVRGETERTSTDKDQLKAYYLAAGSVYRTLNYIQWGPAYYRVPTPVVHFDFPTGSATVEVIPDSAKLSVNTATAEELQSLLVALGVDPGQAPAIVSAIVDWRSASPGGSFTEFDQHYLSMTPSFRARHASFQEIEELLLVQGVTPELFYGGYTEDAHGRLAPRAGLRDCLSVYGSRGPIDVNTVEQAVMRAIGVSPEVAAAIVAARKAAPFKTMDQFGSFRDSSPGAGRLGIVPSSIVTLRATAQLKGPAGQPSDIRHSVSALVKFLAPPWNPPFHILRWYDNAVSPQ